MLEIDVMLCHLRKTTTKRFRPQISRRTGNCSTVKTRISGSICGDFGNLRIRFWLRLCGRCVRRLEIYQANLARASGCNPSPRLSAGRPLDGACDTESFASGVHGRRFRIRLANRAPWVRGTRYAVGTPFAFDRVAQTGHLATP
jgi:hypothetical protein